MSFGLFHTIIYVRALTKDWRQFLTDSWREEERFISIHRYILHVHIENEIAAFADAIRLENDVSITLLDDLFYDCQTKSYPLTVHLCCALKFAELREK